MSRSTTGRSMPIGRIAAVVIASAFILAFASLPSPAAAQSAYQVWATNQANDVVAIIEPDSWQVTATIDVNEGGFGHGAKPHMIAFSPSGKYAYVANVGAAADTNNVTVIRTADRSIATQIQTAGSAHAAIPSHDGRRVWIYNTGANLVTEVMVDEAQETWTVSRTLDLAIRPICGMFTPDNSHVYVTLGGNADNPGAIAIVNVASGEVVRRVETGREACGTALSRNRQRMYVNTGWHARNDEALNDQWFVFDPGSHEELRRGQLEGVKDNHGLGETIDGRELWILNRQSSSVSILDTASWAVKATIGTADKPDIIDFSPDGRYAFWTLRGQPQTGDPHALAGTMPGVEVFDVAARQSVAIVPIAGDTHGLAVLSMAPATGAVLPAALPATGRAGVDLPAVASDLAGARSDQPGLGLLSLLPGVVFVLAAALASVIVVTGKLLPSRRV